MKKILKIAFGLLLVCSLTTYQSCVKVDEFNAVKTDVDNIKNTELPSLKAQGESLQKAVDELEQAKTALNNEIKTLKENKADKSVVDALAARVTATETAINTINTQIKVINEALASKASQADLDKLSKDVFDKTTELASQIAEIGGTANAAKANADKALEQLTSVYTKEEVNALLGGYVEFGVFQDHVKTYLAKVAELQAADRVNADAIAAANAKIATLETDVATLKLDLEAFKTEVDIKIFNAIEAEKADRDTAIKEAKDAVDERIDGIDVQIAAINAQIANLAGTVEEIAGRVNTISVLPTTKPEYTVVTGGPALLDVSFLVQPKEALAALQDPSNWTLLAQKALVRTKSDLGTAYGKDAMKVFEADATTGIVHIVAFIDALALDENNGCYFALQLNTDKYSVTSDYALAIESDEHLDPIQACTWGWLTKEGAQIFEGPETLLKCDSTVYKGWQDLKDVRVAEYQPVARTSEGEVLDSVAFRQKYGVTLTFQYPSRLVAGDPMKFDEATRELVINPDMVTDDNDAINNVGNFVTFGIGGTEYKVRVNGQEVDFPKITAQHVLSSYDQADTDTPTIFVYWNYKATVVDGKIRSSKSEVPYSTPLWIEAYNNGAKTTTKAEMGTDWDWSASEIFGPTNNDDPENPYWYNALSVYTENVIISPSDSRTVSATIVKKKDVTKTYPADIYTFNAQIVVEPMPFDEGVVEISDEITNPITPSLSEPTTINVLALNEHLSENLVDVYLKGLDPEVETNAFYTDFLANVSIEEVKLGSTILTMDEDYSIAWGGKGEFDILFNMGVIPFGQSNVVSYTIKYKGITYNGTVTFASTGSGISLDLSNAFDKTEELPVAKVYGHVDGTYKIDQVHSNKLMSVTDSTGLLENVADKYVKYTNVSKEAGITGDIDCSKTLEIALAPTLVEGEYVLADTHIIGWGNYDALKVDFEAKVFARVGGSDIELAKTNFRLVTFKPVKYDSAPEKIELTRTPTVDLNVLPWKDSKVVGFNNGNYDYDESRNLIKADGSIDAKFPNCKLIYKYGGVDITEETADRFPATVNGVPGFLVEGVNYTLGANGSIVLKGDGAVMSAEFDITASSVCQGCRGGKDLESYTIHVVIGQK